MDSCTKEELKEAIHSIASMIDRSENAQGKFAPGTSQHTLQKNRINALYIASALIKQELTGQNIADKYSKEDLKKAVDPIASLISKSDKARGKLKPGTWQHTMLTGNLKALYIASPLLAAALGLATTVFHMQ